MSRQVVIGAVLAAVSWAISGIAALFSPTGDASELGSVSFYVIEGTHAIAETGVLIALVGMWGAGPWTRSIRIALIVAMVSTGLLALLTYLTVVLMAAGVSPEATGDVASLFSVASLLGTLIGFVWLGIALARSRRVRAPLGCCCSRTRSEWRPSCSSTRWASRSGCCGLRWHGSEAVMVT